MFSKAISSLKIELNDPSHQVTEHKNKRPNILNFSRAPDKQFKDSTKYNSPTNWKLQHPANPTKTPRIKDT
ncbi:MAG: hypothetical protein OEM38_07850 [Gammaproteobacteria bacterium]|nr:hypothetical protein [Gammaproteobacteria bacterium]